MKQLVNKTTLKMTLFLIAVMTFGVFAWSGSLDTNRSGDVVADVPQPDEMGAKPDKKKAVAAFGEMSKVLFSARCANCHPAGDTPTQGDAMTPHTQGVTRGPKGEGVTSMHCATCHQQENLDGPHLPPGVSKGWHMPPTDQRMVFQGLTPGQLCRNLKDPSKNGGHNGAEASMEHILKKDPLVMWAWEPGNGRTTPPMTFAEFESHINDWIANGADCPK